jgi:hypothetical protein
VAAWAKSSPPAEGSAVGSAVVKVPNLGTCTILGWEGSGSQATGPEQQPLVQVRPFWP